MNLAGFIRLPCRQHPLRKLDDDVCVSGDAFPVKRRLCQSPLTQPEIPFTRQ
jgi:hypothetical protein